MNMQNYTTPFANTGDTEEFSIDTDPSGKVSLEKGWTELYQLRPEEGGLFILRKVFNQMMKLVSTDTVTWKTQTFPNWIDDKGDGLPFAYPKNVTVKYTDGNTYVSLVDNNTSLPTDTDNWINFEDFGSLNINSLPDKPTPINTDNLALQETGGLLKKLSFANLMAWIKSFSFGWGQTWQDVTASRSSGVTYTNNTNKPIEFNCSFNVGVGASWSFTTTVDGILSGGGAYGSITIPVGSTYSYTSSGGVSNIKIRELR